jgi:hypothetical protein
MRKPFLFLVTFVALGFLVGGASATVLTEQQVKNTCGGNLQTGGGGGTTASGCEKKCGDQICTYNCCSGKGCGEQGCHGHVVGKAVGPSGGKVKLPLPAAVVKEIKASSAASSNLTTTSGPTGKSTLGGTKSNLTNQGTSGTALKPKQDLGTTTKR